MILESEIWFIFSFRDPKSYKKASFTVYYLMKKFHKVSDHSFFLNSLIPGTFITGENEFTSFDGAGNQDTIDVVIFWEQDEKDDGTMDNSTCAQPGELKVTCVDNGDNIYDGVYFMVRNKKRVIKNVPNNTIAEPFDRKCSNGKKQKISGFKRIINYDKKSIKPEVGMIQDLGWLPVTTATRIFFSGWLPVTTAYHILRFRTVTVDYHLSHISLLLVTIGYQHDLHPPVTCYHRLPACPISAGNRLPALTKKSKFFRSPGNRTC